MTHLRLKTSCLIVSQHYLTHQQTISISICSMISEAQYLYGHCDTKIKSTPYRSVLGNHRIMDCSFSSIRKLPNFCDWVSTRYVGLNGVIEAIDCWLVRRPTIVLWISGMFGGENGEDLATWSEGCSTLGNDDRQQHVKYILELSRKSYENRKVGAWETTCLYQIWNWGHSSDCPTSVIKDANRRPASTSLWEIIPVSDVSSNEVVCVRFATSGPLITEY